MFFANTATEGAGVLLALMMLIVGIAWLIFPFVVMSKLDKIHTTLRDISAKLPKTAAATPPLPPAAAPQNKKDAESVPVYKLD